MSYRQETTKYAEKIAKIGGQMAPSNLIRNVLQLMLVVSLPVQALEKGMH